MQVQTTNDTSPPRITVDDGCTVSLAHSAAFRKVVQPGTIKSDVTNFATAGNDIVSKENGELKIVLQRNNGASVTFTESKLFAS